MKGNFIGFNNAPSFSSANGIWNLREQYQAIKTSAWPIFAGITNGLVFYVDAGKTGSYSGSGTAWSDLTGNASTGELVSSPSYSPGNGGYFGFSGSNYARWPNSTALDTNTPTVELWIKTNNTAQSAFFFEKGTVNSQYALFLESNSYVYWRSNGQNDLAIHTSTLGMTTSSWLHLVATYANGSGKKLYANGTLAGSDGSTGNIAVSSGGMSVATYGGYTGSHSYYYSGNLAICRVYNRALSQSEIQVNYNVEKSRFGL